MRGALSPRTTTPPTRNSMHQSMRLSPFRPLARIAALVALGDLLTKQVAVAWVDALDAHVSSMVRFGVVHNDKGAFGLTAGNYTFELSLLLTIAAILLIIPATRDLARVDERAPVALGLVAGGAIGNLVSLLVSPAGVVDFIAVQRADGAGLVLNVADLAAYTGVVLLMRTVALVIAAIRRSRDRGATDVSLERSVVLSRLADLELVRVVAREGGAANEATKRDAPKPNSRPVSDKPVQLRVVHADGAPQRPGKGLAARLRDIDSPRSSQGSAYLRPMSHPQDLRR